MTANGTTMNRTEVAFTIGLILLSVGVIYFVSQWDLPTPPLTNEQSTTEWVLLQPQKCTEIPWRKEWSEENHVSYASFPVTQEISIIKNYYQKKGITVLHATLSYQETDPLCTQCGCPERIVFGIQTTVADAAKLSVSGFKILDTTNPYIFTGPLFRQSTDQPISAVHEEDCADIFTTHTIIDEWLGNKQDSCYIQAAIGARNVSVCEHITNTGPHTTCITEVATALHSPGACETISSASGKDTCYAQVAGVLHNAALCVHVQDSTARSICELGAHE